MTIRSVLGLDWFDVILHVVITAVVTAGVVETAKGSNEEAIVATMLVSSSLVLLGVRRYFALRRLNRTRMSTGEMAAERIAELEQRVEELEASQARLAELEERLDFTERLLARGAGSERGELVQGDPR